MKIWKKVHHSLTILYDASHISQVTIYSIEVITFSSVAAEGRYHSNPTQRLHPNFRTPKFKLTNRRLIEVHLTYSQKATPNVCRRICFMYSTFLKITVSIKPDTNIMRYQASCPYNLKLKYILYNLAMFKNNKDLDFNILI